MGRRTGAVCRKDEHSADGSQTLPHRRIVCGRVVSADFFGASPVASALGIRSGATPRGQSITAAHASARGGNYNGRR